MMKIHRNHKKAFNKLRETNKTLKSQLAIAEQDGSEQDSKPLFKNNQEFTGLFGKGAGYQDVYFLDFTVPQDLSGSCSIVKGASNGFCHYRNGRSGTLPGCGIGYRTRSEALRAGRARLIRIFSRVIAKLDQQIKELEANENR